MKKSTSLLPNLKILIALLKNNFIFYIKHTYQQEDIFFIPLTYKNEFRHFNEKLSFLEILYIFFAPHRKLIFNSTHNFKKISFILFELGRKIYAKEFHAEIKAEEKFFVISYFFLKEKYNLIKNKIYERTTDFNLKNSIGIPLIYFNADEPIIFERGVYIIYNRDEYVIIEIKNFLF